MLFKSLFILSFSLISFQAFAHDYKSCQIKKEKLQQQIAHAKKHNNAHRVKGLEKALARVGQQCAQIKSNKSSHPK
ncbi:hypothetical protein A6M14_00105 [Acinetobacter sp. Ac_877]|uniref:DUF1090 family protein n=1 Tax=Acinetobacter portensis TaxID=1839785 RepID=UPI00128D6EBB|nr:DUF1090 family protein [Acinetobacter portensis]MPW41063.1 hypothetical protein [Acinetobacter portensis]